ncbi:MAG TPA: C-terminal binding protein [Usitatibacter sp.]|nr:C-terminal binding protein [Usitatibacter sp.]
MRFLVTDHDFPDVALEREVVERAGHELSVAQCRTEDDVIGAARGCAGALVQYAPMNARVFAALPELRIVSRFGAGFDTVNVKDAKEHGVWVANSPDYGVGEVAAHALGMAIGLVRHIPWFNRDVHAGRWDYNSTGPVRRLSGLTLGILGVGRIGKRMAAFAKPLFGRVIGCDPYVDARDFPDGVERVSRERLFPQADVLSLHVPLTDETRHGVDAAALAAMKRGSYLVNTARGPVVDVPALLAALDSGQIEAAALDVLPKEPPVGDDPVLRHPRLLLTPHAAFYSTEGEKELRTKAAMNLVEWARTGKPTYVVSEGR